MMSYYTQIAEKSVCHNVYISGTRLCALYLEILAIVYKKTYLLVVLKIITYMYTPHPYVDFFL